MYIYIYIYIYGNNTLSYRTRGLYIIGVDGSVGEDARAELYYITIYYCVILSYSIPSHTIILYSSILTITIITYHTHNTTYYDRPSCSSRSTSGWRCRRCGTCRFSTPSSCPSAPSCSRPPTQIVQTHATTPITSKSTQHIQTHH